MMAALKPWYKIDGLTPREDLREGKPLDASEFAVHLDKVRDETAPPDYKEPARFTDCARMETLKITFQYQCTISAADVEISDDVFILDLRIDRNDKL